METKKKSMFSMPYLTPLICASLATMSNGVRYTVTSVFITAICADFEIGRSTLMLWQTIVYVITLFSTPYWGKQIRKFGMDKAVLICGIATTIGYCLWPLSTNVYWIYAAAVLFGAFNAPVSVVCASISLTDWFKKDTGKAIGIALIPLSINSIVWPLFMGNLIESWGWHKAIWLYVILNGLCTIPTAFGLKSPAQKGVKAYGEDEVSAASPTTKLELKGTTAAAALKSPAFYLLWIGVLVAQLPMGFLSSTVPWGTDHGFTASQAGTLLSIIAFVGMFGTPIAGTLHDKLGSKLSAIILLGAGAVGFVVCVMSGNNYVMAVIGMVLFALLASWCTTLPATITEECFGPKDYAKIYSYIAIAVQAKSIISPYVMNLVFDITGSYDGAMIAYAICSVLAIILLCLAVGKRPKWEA